MLSRTTRTVRTYLCIHRSEHAGLCIADLNIPLYILISTYLCIYRKYISVYTENIYICIYRKYISIYTENITRKLQNVQHDSNMAVSAKSITEIVSKLECGKSAGPDGISAGCFKFSNTKIHVLLSLLFSMCLSHGYLPSTLIKTTIVPMVKNKAGDLSDSNNYRPIAIANITAKLLESVLPLKCSDYLTTCDNRFGFKASHERICAYIH